MYDYTKKGKEWNSRKQYHNYGHFHGHSIRNTLKAVLTFFLFVIWC